MKKVIKEDINNGVNYRDIYSHILKSTDNLNNQDGVISYGDKKEVDMAKSILDGAYPNVQIRDLDKNGEGDNKYYLLYSYDVNENFDDELKFSPNLNPEGTPISKAYGAGMGENLEESGALWDDEVFDAFHDSDEYPLKDRTVYPWTWEGPDENGKYKRVSTEDGHIIGWEEADRIAYELRRKKKLGEAVEKHDTLNQKIFNGDELDPEVKEKLLEIVDRFKYNLEENDIKLDIKDVRIIGSNASYNYTDKSDIDLHIFADLSVYPDQEMLAQKVYDAYKALWNNKFDPVIRGHEVEIYVEPYTGD